MVFNILQVVFILLGLFLMFKGSDNLIKGYSSTIGKLLSMLKYKIKKQ